MHIYKDILTHELLYEYHILLYNNKENGTTIIIKETGPKPW